ncbi:MAG: serine/threonine protein kinase [Rhodothermales bacterium]
MPMQQSDSSIGQVIDGYRILEVLGKGGMGIVYKAEDIALSRAIAIKMIAPDLSSNESFLRRFHSEARALARVESPFIVGVHALRQVDDNFFIVMEYVDGWTLADDIEKGVIEFSRARVVLKQMLQAFAKAHSVGVIHRDIKPRNIMITKAGRVKVTDFGLAKLRQDDGKSTVTQGMAGTARYMSPEQVLGSSIDPRSDLYSLGMTMYEMLAGVLPFGVEEGTFSILKRIVEEELPSPLEYNPNIPAKLVSVIQKAIQKDPAKRYQSAQEMLDALEHAFATPRESKTIATPQPSQIHIAPQDLQKKSKKTPFLIAAAVVGLLLIYPVSKLISGGGAMDGGLPPTLAEAEVPGTPGGEGSAGAPIELAEFTVATIPAGARVAVNRDLKGVSTGEGLLVRVEPGEILLGLELDGYKSVDTLITVAAGSENLFTLPMSRIPISPVRTTNVDEPPKTDPAPPAVQFGSVQFTAKPRGVIQVNGSTYRDSTKDLKLPIGRHKVKFDNGSGVTKETEVVVTAGETVSRICYFEYDLTVVTSWKKRGEPPYAHIYINNEDINETTPLAFGVYKLTPGAYTISLRRQGYELSEPQSLRVVPTFDLEETKPKLFFTIKEAQ